MTTEHKDIDIFDAISMGGSAIVIASVVSGGGSLAIGIPLMLYYFLQHSIRRTQWFDNVVDMIAHPMLNNVARGLLLPAPKEDTALAIYQNKPLDVNVVNESPFWRSMIDPDIKPSDSALVGVVEKYTSASQLQKLIQAIKRLPKYIPFTTLESPPSKLAVPIGIESDNKRLLWADFGDVLDTKIIHALIAGYTGSGKDALLRLWFATLTQNNTPEELQFVIIDGKVDWLSPALAESAYMAIPPSGGVDIQKISGKYIDCAKDQMAKSFEWIFEEVQRRQKLFSSAGAIDMKSYSRKSGIRLPYVFFIASDIGETFDGDLKMLMNLLIMKGRAYGIRLIISLQNPVGEATKWRSQIGLIMTGHQPNPDHDRYTLGINVDRMRFRPSMLPNPEQSDISHGLFIVRRGSDQHLVRTAHMPEEDWETYIETIMSTKHDYTRKKNDTALLQQLLLPSPIKDVKRYTISRDVANAIIDWTQRGKNKTEIMTDLLKATNPDKYKALSPMVDILMQKVKERIANAT